jgi:hypothetical protein
MSRRAKNHPSHLPGLGSGQGLLVLLGLAVFLVGLVWQILMDLFA